MNSVKTIQPALRASLFAFFCLHPFLLTADVDSPSPTRTFGYGAVHTMALSQDGRHLITGGSVGAFLWEASTGELVRRFAVSEVWSIAISPTSRSFLAGANERAELRDVATGQLLQQFHGGRSVVFSPDGTKALTTDLSSVFLWSVQTGERLQTFEAHSGNSMSPAIFSPDGTRILTGSRDLENAGSTDNIRLWDSHSGKLLKTYSPRYEYVGSGTVHLAFSPDGNHFLAANHFSGPAFLYRVQDDVPVMTIEGSGPLAYSRDGSLFATGLPLQTDSAENMRSGARLWNATTGNLIREIEMRAGPPHSRPDLLLSPDAKELFLMDSRDSQLKVFGVATGELQRAFDITSHEVTGGEMSRSGKVILTHGWHKVWLWDSLTSQLKLAIDVTNADSLIRCATLSPDGSTILVGASRGRLSLYDARTGNHLRDFSGVGETVWAVAFSPDGNRAVASSGNAIHLWDIQTGAVVGTFSGHTARINEVAFSADGKRLLSGSNDKTAKLWNVETRELIRSFGNSTTEVWSVGISPDGSRLLTGHTGETKLWNTESGQLLRRLAADHWVFSVAFSPDGKLALANGTDGDNWISLWDLSTGILLRTFRTKTTANAATFSPDGMGVFIVDQHAARLWDIRDLLPRPRAVSSATGHKLEWDLGTLQFAPSINGPWTDLPAASPLQLSTIGEQGFFRVKLEP